MNVSMGKGGFNQIHEYDSLPHPSNRSTKPEMALNRADVEKIAHLARLQVDEQEAKAFAASLSRILELIEQMNAVDTTGVTPMAHPQEAGLRLREDRVTEVNAREKLQRNAPATERDLYLVPKVIE